MAAWSDTLGSPQALGQALWQRGPQLVTVLCIAWLAIEAGLLLTFQPPRAPPAAIGSGGAPEPLQLASIVNAHLFGVYQNSTTDAANAPQTTISLVLTGVIASGDPEHGQAIIGPDAGNTRLYSTGETLPQGAKLHSVYRDRVLLDRNGVIEALMLPNSQSSTASMLATPPAAGAGTGGQRLQVMAQNNPALIGGLVRTQPVFQQGKLSGFRIFPSGGRRSALAFNQLQLRSGDMITAVNGTALDDPTRASDVLQTLSSAATASVTIVRGGVAQELTLNLDAVADEVEGAASELSQGPPGIGGPRLGNRRPDPGAPSEPTTVDTQ